MERVPPIVAFHYVPNKSRNKQISRIMINTFGPNGANSCLIIGKPDADK